MLRLPIFVEQNAFFVAGQAGHVDGPNNPFLAVEFGPGTLELGAVPFKPRGTSAGFRAGGRAPVSRFLQILQAESESPRPPARVFVTYNVFQNGFDDGRSLGTLFTDGGGLGIPGTGDPNANFPAGVFLPFAGGLNTVTDMNGSFDFDTVGGGFAFGVPFPVGGGVTVAPVAGIDFASINQDIRFSGAVPGFALDFLYDTNANAFQLSPNLGAEVIIPLIVNDTGGPGPNVALQIIPRVYVDTLFFRGSDSLELSGIVNDAQKVGLDGSDTNVGFSLEGNFIIQDILNLPLDLKVGGFVSQRHTSIVIERSGETGEQSKAVASDFWAAGVNFGLELRY